MNFPFKNYFIWSKKNANLDWYNIKHLLSHLVQ